MMLALAAGERQDGSSEHREEAANPPSSQKPTPSLPIFDDLGTVLQHGQGIPVQGLVGAELLKGRLVHANFGVPL